MYMSAGLYQQFFLYSVKFQRSTEQEKIYTVYQCTEQCMIKCKQKKKKTVKEQTQNDLLAALNYFP